jgi:hypothetical protein
MSFFFKNHKYKTQADLQGMSAEQIINLEPNDVRHDIDENDGGRRLEGVERSAMYALLSIKKIEKENGKNESRRQSAIRSFLQGKNIIPNLQVDAVVHGTKEEIGKKHLETVRDGIFVHNMKQKMANTFNEEPPPELTFEQKMLEKTDKLGGKRKGKTVSKRKRRGKTRKGRKTK